MGVIAQQSIKGALANYLGIIIGFVTTFFVLTDCLTADEIGLTRVLVDASMLFAGLAQLGTNASIVRFAPYFKVDNADTTKRKRRMSGLTLWALAVPMVGFAVIATVCLLFRQPITELYSENSPLVTRYYHLLLPLTFAVLYMTVFETYASTLLRITVPKLVREVGIRVMNLISYLLYGHRVVSLDTFVWLFCCSYFIAMLINVGYLIHLKKKSEHQLSGTLSPELMRRMVTYTLLMTATVLAGNIPLFNSLFIGAKAGLAMTGVYTIASYIANIVEVPYRSLGAITGPLIAQALKEGNNAEVNRIGQKVSHYQLLVASMIFFFIWTNLRALFAVIPHGSEYEAGMGVVMLLGMAKIVNSSLSVSTTIVNYSRNYAISLPMIAILTASALLFNQWLIPVMGINGSALATLAAYLLYFTLLLAYLHFRQHIDILSRQQLLSIALLAALLLLNFLWNKGITPLVAPNHSTFSIVVDALLRSAVLLGIATTAILRLRMAPEMNEKLQSFTRRFNHPTQ